MEKELDLAVSCYGKVKPLNYDLTILPWGATEPHNLHLPYLTDCILSHDIAVDAAKQALNRYGVRGMRLTEPRTTRTGLLHPLSLRDAESHPD